MKISIVYFSSTGRTAKMAEEIKKGIAAASADIEVGLFPITELTAYNEMMNDARALATKRMVAEAEELGADAVVNIRYASAAVMQGAAEVMAYGTAVKFI